MSRRIRDFGKVRRWSVLRLCAAVVALHTAGAACVSADRPSNSSPLIDRGLQQPLATARSQIARGQIAEAIRSLQTVLGGSENTLVFIDGRYIDAKMAANRLIAGLPPEGLSLYEREFGTLARRDLDRAQATGRIDQILAVAATYRHTQAGRQALAAAAGLFFDGGQFVEAVSLARQLLEIAGTPQESAAAARLVMAWLELGQVDSARQWVETRRTLLSRHDVDIQGIKQPLDQWLLERIRKQSGRRDRGALVHTGGHPQTVGSGAFDWPSTGHVWNKRFDVSGVTASVADELIARRVESGIPPVIHSVPLIVGQTLVVRRSDELAAYDVRGGETRWSIDLSPPGSGSLDSETIADRALAGGPHWAISSDGERVFTVVEDSASYVRPVFTGRGRRIPVELPPKNSLSAYDLRRGNREWQLAEIQPLGRSSTEHGDRDVDFLGPPLACRGTLYVLGRTNEGANVLALDPADGKVRWGESLAGFSGFETDGTPSYGPACMPVERDGLLICPTPEGIVIAVDLATRTCRWAYRALPTEEPSPPPARWGRRFQPIEARWLNGWRENVVRLDERRCFFVSPRSSRIHALGIDSGELLWTRPVANGLFLGPIVDGRLIVLSKCRAMAFDTATGALVWSVAIGLPGGRGYLAQGRYLLPQSAGGLAAIDVHTGAVEFPLPGETAPLGNLVPLPNSAAGAAVSQSHERLALLASLGRLRADAADRLRQRSADPDALRHVARLDREAGDFQNAERHYAELLELDKHRERAASPASRRAAAGKAPLTQRESKPAVPLEKPPAELLLLHEESEETLSQASRRELFETLVADIEHHPKRCPQLAAGLLRLATGDTQRAVALRTVGKALAADGERMLGLAALLELARLELPPQIEIERGPRRVVAFERQLGADLHDLLEDCSKEERRQAAARIEQAFERPIDQGDVALFSRVFQRLRSAGLDRAVRRKVEAALRPDPAFSQTQLELWEATTSDKVPRAAEAWRDLAELCRAHGNRRQAALCYRRLAADFSQVRFSDGLRPGDLIAAGKDDRPLSREIEEAGTDPWPTSMPDAIPDTDSGSSAQFFHLPIEILPGSLCERLDVALDHQGETLRFQGNGHSTYWDLRLPLENARFKGVIPLHRAWCIGPVVVVQVGTDLFAVAPEDEGGEPSAKVLWHVDLLVSPSAAEGDLDVRFVPGALAVGGERISVTDRLGRPVARVGPVRPGYVCYQDRGSLVALDPLSGRVLWRRTDALVADLSAGSDAMVLLVDRRSKRLQFLRALDGKTIAERTAATASSVRWLEGLDAMTEVAQSRGPQLQRIDLLNDRVKWTQSFPPETQFVRLDGRKYVAAEAKGTFHVLDADRGTVITSHHLAQVKHCLQVHVTSDESRFYLAFSGTFADARNFRANGQRDESRNPLVSGALCAVDRRGGQMLWERPFLDGSFALDQSRAAPILVFSYRQYRRGSTDDEESGLAWPILHCIDKRTGRDVFKERFGSVQPYSRNFAEAELGRHEVIVRWPDSSIRFRYSR